MLEVAFVPSTAAAVATLLALLAVTTILLYIYATRNFAYWRRKGVPHRKPFPFVGNLIDVVLFRKHFGEFLQDVYQNMKGDRYFGIYAFDTPVLLVKDQTLIKDILRKDFGHFTDKGFTASRDDPMNLHALFCRKGKEWKDLRIKLAPAFTSGKLKKFYALIDQNARNLDTYFDESAKKGVSQDVTDACGRYTTDVVASVGFGIDSSSLRDGETEFRKALKHTFVFKKAGVLWSIGQNTGVPLSHQWGSKLVPDDLTAFLRRSIWNTVRHRQETGTVGVRGDYLDLLIDLREKGSIAEDEGDPNNDGKEDKADRKLSLEGDAFVSQAFTFLSAGFETSSSTMSFALFHLANEHDIQDELRTRLQEAIQENGGKLKYEVLQGVKYLDMVVMETLRLHPVLPFVDRTCTNPYQIPGTDEVIDKGIVVLISQDGIHSDPELYPEPDRFDPERFSDVNRASRPTCSFLAFGDGPRQCIGMRLGLLQAKVGLAHILLNYRVHRASDTPLKAENDMESVLYHPKSVIPLLFSRV